MRSIEVTVVNEDNKVLLRTEFTRQNKQGEQPEGYRYFHPDGWMIIVKPPMPDHNRFA